MDIIMYIKTDELFIFKDARIYGLIISFEFNIWQT